MGVATKVCLANLSWGITNIPICKLSSYRQFYLFFSTHCIEWKVNNDQFNLHYYLVQLCPTVFTYISCVNPCLFVP